MLGIEGEIGVKLEEIKFIEEKVLEDMSTVVKAMKNIKLVLIIVNNVENGTGWHN